MGRLIKVLSFSALLVSFSAHPGNDHTGQPSNSTLQGSPPQDTIVADTTDTSNRRPTFTRTLLTGVWWIADKHEPSAVFVIDDSTFNFVDRDPEHFYQYAIRQDTLVIFNNDTDRCVIKKLTHDSLVVDWSFHTETYVHTEPQ